MIAVQAQFADPLLIEISAGCGHKYFEAHSRAFGIVVCGTSKKKATDDLIAAVVSNAHVVRRLAANGKPLDSMRDQERCLLEYADEIIRRRQEPDFFGPDFFRTKMRYNCKKNCPGQPLADVI